MDKFQKSINELSVILQDIEKENHPASILILETLLKQTVKLFTNNEYNLQYFNVVNCQNNEEFTCNSLKKTILKYSNNSSSSSSIVYELNESKTIIEEMDIDKNCTELEIFGIETSDDEENVKQSTSRKKKRQPIGHNYSEETGEGMGYSSFIIAGPYLCILCSETCTNATNYLCHLRKHTVCKNDREYLSCTKCTKEIIVHKECKQGPGKDTLYRQAFIRLCQHVISYHDVAVPNYLKIYSCRLCNYETIVRPNYRKHVEYCKRQSGTHSNFNQSSTVNKTAKALIREKTGIKKSDSYAGPIFKNDLTSYSCFLCPMQLSSEENLIEHIKLQHAETTETKPRTSKSKLSCLKFKCSFNDCSQTYTSRKVSAAEKEAISKLLYHVLRTHKIQEPDFVRIYECDTCQERVLLQMSKSHLQKHLQDTAMVMCENCAEFMKESVYEKHKEKCRTILKLPENAEELFDINESESDFDLDEDILKQEDDTITHVKGVFLNQQPFYCFVCTTESNLTENTTMSSLEELIRHFQEIHMKIDLKNEENDYLNCDHCEYIVHIPKARTANGPQQLSLFKQTISTLMNHYVIRHETTVPNYAKIYKCWQCSFTSLSRSSWRRHHYKIHTKKSENKQPTIKRSNEMAVEKMEKFPAIFKNSMIIKCFFCNDDDETVDNEDGILRHVLQDHTIKVNNDKCLISCQYCDRLFSSGYELEEIRLTVSRFLAHVTNSHSFSLPKSSLNFYTCTFCTYQSIVYSAIKRHILRHTFTVECMACNQWIRIADLSLHRRKYCSKPPKATVTNNGVTCNICNRSYPTLEAVKVHQRRMHEGKRNYECAQCDATFFGRAEWLGHCWVRHKLNVSNRQLLECRFCNYKTVVRDLLNKHMKNHIRGQFVCKHCDKIVSTKAQFEVHQRRCHPNESKFIKCKICSFSTPDRTKLQRHIQQTHPTVQFQCRSCQFRHVDAECVTKHESRMHKVLQQPINQLPPTIYVPEIGSFDMDREQQSVILFQPSDNEIVLDDNFEQVIIESNFQ